MCFMLICYCSFRGSLGLFPFQGYKYHFSSSVFAYCVFVHIHVMKLFHFSLVTFPTSRYFVEVVCWQTCRPCSREAWEPQGLQWGQTYSHANPCSCPAKNKEWLCVCQPAMKMRKSEAHGDEREWKDKTDTPVLANLWKFTLWDSLYIDNIFLLDLW